MAPDSRQQRTARQPLVVLLRALWEAGCLSLQRDRDLSGLNHVAPLILPVTGAVGNCCALCYPHHPSERMVHFEPRETCWPARGVLCCDLGKRQPDPGPAASLRSSQKAKRHMRKHKSLVCCDSALGLLEGHLPPWLQWGLQTPPVLLRSHPFSLMIFF